MTSNELLIESFERAAAEQGRLTGRFYELLFTRYPAARALFGRHSLARQEQMLQETLVAVLDHVEDAEWLEETLGNLGAQHLDYGVEDAMYGWVGECLIAALAETNGEHWTPAHAEAWAAVYGLLTELALKGAAARRATVA